MIRILFLFICFFTMALFSFADLEIDIYNPNKTCEGTTFLADLHDQNNPRIIEIDMHGAILWEYAIPDEYKEFIDPGLDVEYLGDDRILFVLPRKGVFDIDRTGNVLWSHLDPQISHDADRLPNGNTIYVYGAADPKTESVVKEIDSDGTLVWSWSARDQFDIDLYSDIFREGWTHTNAVTRLPDGNTMVSLRNFSLTVAITPAGEIAWSIDWTALVPTTFPPGLDPHDPEIQADGTLLVCLQRDSPYQVVEIDLSDSTFTWTYHRDGLRTARDADRLPNGNTLIVGVLEPDDESVIFEVTPEGNIVWQLKVVDYPAADSPGWFYKAQRVSVPTQTRDWLILR